MESKLFSGARSPIAAATPKLEILDLQRVTDEKLAVMARYRLLPDPSAPRGWNILVFVLEICLFVPALWWVGYSHLPAPGWSVACLAVAATLMTIQDRMTDWQKVGWVTLMAFFLVIELRAISKDRWDSQVVQENDRGEERRAFGEA
jgi:hypothetical protein